MKQGKKSGNGRDGERDLPDFWEIAPACLRLDERAPEHAFDGWADQGRVAKDHKLVAVARHERDVLAFRHGMALG